MAIQILFKHTEHINERKMRLELFLSPDCPRSGPGGRTLVQF